MKPVQNFAEHIGTLAEYGHEYVDQKIEHAKLEVVEKGARISAELAARLIVFAFGFLTIFFSLISAAFLINKWIQSLALSFALISVLTLICGVSFYAYKRQLLTNPLISVFIKLLFDEEESENSI